MFIMQIHEKCVIMTTDNYKVVTVTRYAHIMLKKTEQCHD